MSCDANSTAFVSAFWLFEASPHTTPNRANSRFDAPDTRREYGAISSQISQHGRRVMSWGLGLEEGCAPYVAYGAVTVPGMKFDTEFRPVLRFLSRDVRSDVQSSGFLIPDFGWLLLLTALRAGPPFSWGATSGGPPGRRSLSKDGTRAESAKDFCRLVGGVYYAGNLISDL